MIPVIKIQKKTLNKIPPARMKFRNFKIVSCFTDGKKLQYYIQIDHIKVTIEAKKNHI
jgi:hypothetical protein